MIYHDELIKTNVTKSIFAFNGHIVVRALNMDKISISVHNYSKTCCTQLLSVFRTEYNRRTRANNDRHNSIAIQYS